MNFSKLTAFLDSLGPRYGVPGYDIRITRDHETIFRIDHMRVYADIFRQMHFLRVYQQEIH